MHIEGMSTRRATLDEADVGTDFGENLELLAEMGQNFASSLDIPDEHNVVASYPITVVSEAPRAHLGALFVEFVLSNAGQTRLAELLLATNASKSPSPSTSPKSAWKLSEVPTLPPATKLALPSLKSTETSREAELATARSLSPSPSKSAGAIALGKNLLKI